MTGYWLVDVVLWMVAAMLGGLLLAFVAALVQEAYD